MFAQKVYVVDLSKSATDAQLDNAVRALKRSMPDKVIFRRSDDAVGQNAVDAIAACGIATEIVAPEWKPSSDHTNIPLH